MSRPRRIYVVTNADYRHGYTGRDHLLPDHHGGMIGRTYPSLEAAQKDLDRRSREAAPAYATVSVVEVTDETVRDAWDALARRYERDAARQGDVRRCRRLAKEAHASQAEVSPGLEVEVWHLPDDWTIRRNEMMVRLGTVDALSVETLTLQAW